MNKKKIRFNIIDVIILLFLAAAIFLLLYIFVFSENGEQNQEINYTNIQYVVEVQNVDKQFEEIVKVGQAVQDAVKRKNIGTVSGVQAAQYQILTFDYESGQQAVSDVENKIVLKITIEAQAIETDHAFTVDGCVIRVGQQYSLALPDMYCVGYCTYIGNAHR